MPANVQYQWLRDGQPIANQTGATYQLTRDDAEHNISVKASYKDSAGHDEAPLSEATAVVADAPAPNPPPAQNHAPTGAVTISGKVQTGETVYASHSLEDADGMGTVNYQWLADGTPIGYGASHALTAAEEGKTITVRAAYTDGAGHAESRDSLATGAVGKPYATPPYTNTFDEKTFK